MNITNQKDENTLPVVYVDHSILINLKCPKCQKEHSVILDKPIETKMRAGCKKCGISFIIIPNMRKHSRKGADILCMLSRRPIKETKKEEVITLKIVDLSDGGIGVIISNHLLAKHDFKSGDLLYICFRIPNSQQQEPTNAKVIIKNIKPEKITASKLGLEFADKKNHDNINYFTIQGID